MFRVISILLICSALVFTGCSDEDQGDGEGLKEKTDGESIAVDVNSPAPAFAARVLGGGEVRLSDYIGSKVVLLEFWSIFCKSCLLEMPAIKELHNRYGDEGLAVLSINTDVFSDTRVMKVLRKAGLTFDYPILRDMRQSVAKSFNVELLPVTVIIDRSGWIRLYQEGYRAGDEERFESVIRKYLRDEEEDDVTLAPRGGVTTIAPAGTRMLQRERVAQPVEAITLEGRKVRLGAGRPSVLFFWSLYCKPCRAEFPQMVALWEKYAANDLDVYSVNVDTKRLAARVNKFAAKYPQIPCLPDWDSATGQTGLAKLFGVGATPTVIVLDARGGVAFASQGKADHHELEAQLQQLISIKSQ